MTSDQAAALSRRYRIGKRKRVTFTAPRPERGGVLRMTAEWEPDIPDQLSRRERRDYEAARLAFIAELAGLIQPAPCEGTA
jgi:hypothetical protein